VFSLRLFPRTWFYSRELSFSLLLFSRTGRTWPVYFTFLENLAFLENWDNFLVYSVNLAKIILFGMFGLPLVYPGAVG